jgi:glyoxylase-like metal-dependent hydrolase (beta-lactamase superfamily II)/rhodanese-related sulfurtransferase
MNITQIRSTDGTGTLSYILSDGDRAAIIDPNLEDVQTIAEMIRSANLTPTHIFDTHTHADHVSGAGDLRKLFGAKVVMHENTKNKWKVVDQGDKFGIGDTLRANAKIPIDIYVNHADVVQIGSMKIHILFTPGHTDNHLTLGSDENLFTGDLLLIGQAGRSDLPGGNAEEQYDSLMNKIFPFPDSTRIYPGHDYENNQFALLGEEKKKNPFLAKRTKAEYMQFVQEFFPPLSESVEGGKMTLQCGAQRVQQKSDKFKSISARELKQMIENGFEGTLLDVREPIELLEIGAINGVQNISVRQLHQRATELPANKTMPIVTVCASGARSTEAAHMLQLLGYIDVMNLIGGTNAWLQEGNPVYKPTRQKLRDEK